MFAQNDLGQVYFKGVGVTKDLTLAHEWFLKAAASGSSHAMVSLGWQYMCGLGVAIDNEKARMWNLRGARWEHEEGANNLGWL